MTNTEDALEVQLKKYRPLEDTAKAREHLSRMCKGDRPTMSIPPQADDFDMVFCRVISKCEELDKALQNKAEPNAVDLCALKKEADFNHFPSDLRMHIQLGWDKCINHLHSKGLLNAVWRDVRNGLPQDNSKEWDVVQNGEVRVISARPSWWNKPDPDNDDYLCGITHWRNRPAPPKPPKTERQDDE